MNIKVDHYIHYVSGSVDQKLDQILTQLATLVAGEKTIMATLADVNTQLDADIAAITDIKGTTDSIEALVTAQSAKIATLTQELQDALNAGADPAALQAIVDKLKTLNDAIAARKAELAAAVVANPQ